jgi:hypothetical protein
MAIGQPDHDRPQLARNESRRGRRASRRQAEDEPDDLPDPRRRRRRIRGLIPLLIILPLCVGLLVFAPFYKEAARFSALTGFVTMIVAIAIPYQSFKKKGFEEDLNRVPFYTRRWTMVFLQIMYAFRYPRLLACWVTLQYFSMVMMIVGGILFESVNWAAKEHPYIPPPPRAVVNVSGNSRLDKLLTDLEDPGKSQAAGDKLAAMAPDEHQAEVAAKLATLTDSQVNNFVRKAAIKALGTWATPKEVPDLVRCFEDFGTRAEAAAALRAVGPSAERDVLPLLKRRDVAREAIGVLEDIGTTVSEPALQELARGTNGFLADPARRALAAITARSK